ncbi:Polysaccharide export protein [uncultured delta proteobacterium]|uniref:Polysaccharide export protein n=1 Tax=uncultured delta proteobacterium TaxID=34034 RepID=A0A212KB91_9DELT|nr:Polysaccharide export protein [uncultured delta proteobacterium]
MLHILPSKRNKHRPARRAFFLTALCCAFAALMAAASPAAAAEGTGAAADPAPFAANLFQGNFAHSKPESREITPGDRILLRLWGGSSFDGTLTVDDQGDIDLPGVGAMTLAGLQESQLGEALRSKLNAAGQESSQIYCRVLNAQPIALVVTGYVMKPGRYSGAASDSVLAFLDRAGGIDPKRGSYRSIHILRGGAQQASFDLYPFVLRGELPAFRLRNNDTIVVREKGISVNATGESRNAARFELRQGEGLGETLMALAEPLPKASHVSISGTRNGAPYNQYLPLRDFRTTPLADGDRVQFLADTPGDTIMVEVTGAIRGASRFPLRNGARLRDLQNYIAVDPVRANLSGLYIKRKSVADRQKRAIADALRRLEQSSMTATSASAEEAQIRSHEADMIAKFAEKARAVEPEGIVVVGEGGKVADIALEDGDIVVIPERSDVVLVNGEVVMPQALVWSAKRSVDAYVEGAGGFTNRADTSRVILIRPNGEVVTRSGDVQPGDQLIVLPRFESKNLQTVKDISQIVYQIAVAAKMVIPF